MFKKIKGGFGEDSKYKVLLPKFEKTLSLREESEVKKLCETPMMRQRCELSDTAFKKLGSRIVEQDGYLVATDNEMVQLLATKAKQKGVYTLEIHGLQKLTVDQRNRSFASVFKF